MHGDVRFSFTANQALPRLAKPQHRRGVAVAHVAVFPQQFAGLGIVRRQLPGDQKHAVVIEEDGRSRAFAAFGQRCRPEPLAGFRVHAIDVRATCGKQPAVDHAGSARRFAAGRFAGCLSFPKSLAGFRVEADNNVPGHAHGVRDRLEQFALGQAADWLGLHPLPQGGIVLESLIALLSHAPHVGERDGGTALFESADDPAAVALGLLG